MSQDKKAGGVSRREFLQGAGLLLALMLTPISCTGSPPKFRETRLLMGTFVTITVYSADEEMVKEAINAAFARIKAIEGKASIFDDQAEAFQLNQEGYFDNPSHDLLELVTRAQKSSQITGGYFDVTVQPLLDLWGKERLWQQSQEVQQQKINDTLRLIGWEKMRAGANRIDFKAEGMKITLGGIAKGYAAEEALAVLRDRGIEHALVDVGGDISALGSKPGGKPWLIDLVNPDDTSQSMASFVFSDKSVATSGNYARYFDPNKKAHHIINPITGYSANHCIGVTLIAERGNQADMLATAVFVMGPEKGLQLVESLNGVEGLIVDARRKIYPSSGLAEYLAERW